MEYKLIKFLGNFDQILELAVEMILSYSPLNGDAVA